MADAQPLAWAEFPELRRLADLRNAGWRLFAVKDAEGTVTRIDGLFVWPDLVYPDADWVDTVMVLSATDAKALRANPDDEVVWTREGTLEDVVDGLLQLPPPGEPGAPRLVRGAAPRLWKP